MVLTIEKETKIKNIPVSGWKLTIDNTILLIQPHDDLVYLQISECCNSAFTLFAQPPKRSSYYCFCGETKTIPNGRGYIYNYDFGEEDRVVLLFAHSFSSLAEPLISSLLIDVLQSLAKTPFEKPIDEVRENKLIKELTTLLEPTCQIAYEA